MKIKVECRPGPGGPRPGDDCEPQSFIMGAVRFRVVEILDRWAARDHSYFKVKADDGRVLLLRRDGASGAWELAGLVGPERVWPHPATTRH